jgi:glycosyltransferase involved in cell wall biosynthesis
MKLSIITINRNNANGLKQTLKSVAEQTFEDFEHIVIDGASTDNSVDIIKNFSHITYYVSEQDNGIYDAMNKGIRHAKGEYCLFLNSGDYLTASTTISEIFPSLNSEDIIYGDLITKNLKGKIKRTIKPDKITIDFFAIDSLSHPSSFIKTALLKQLGFYRTDLQIVSDWAFFLEAIFKKGASYKHIPVFVSMFTLGGISTNPKNSKLDKKEREIVWKDLFPYIYNDILRLSEPNAELKRVYRIPGVKFFMNYVYPVISKIKKFYVKKRALL